VGCHLITTSPKAADAGAELGPAKATWGKMTANWLYSYTLSEALLGPVLEACRP
jgi:hypothetical protein